jgi:hypothetical protein
MERKRMQFLLRHLDNAAKQRIQAITGSPELPDRSECTPDREHEAADESKAL